MDFSSTGAWETVGRKIVVICYLKDLSQLGHWFKALLTGEFLVVSQIIMSNMSCVRNGASLRKVFAYLCTEYGSYIYMFEEMLEWIKLMLVLFNYQFIVPCTLEHVLSICICV